MRGTCLCQEVARTTGWVAWVTARLRWTNSPMPSPDDGGPPSDRVELEPRSRPRSAVVHWGSDAADRGPVTSSRFPLGSSENDEGAPDLVGGPFVALGGGACRLLAHSASADLRYGNEV